MKTSFSRSRRRALAAVLALAAFWTGEAVATVVTLNPVRDNTLYESTTGSQSDGAGSYLFAGLTDAKGGEPGEIRRGILAFDIAGSVPVGSVIESASLTLEMSRTRVDAFNFTLHRANSNWGEGTSNADGQEGAGANSTTNDATWIHTFYPGSLWTTPGGDFSATASATTLVGKSLGSYTWGSTPQMVADAQIWLDAPASNFGWILRGPEGLRSAKRFNSRENADIPSRPALMIQFTSGGPQIFNWIGTGAGESFHDPANWDTNTAPSASTDIVNLINTTATDQVATLSSSVSIDDLTISGQTNSMSLHVGQGLAANVGDLQVGTLGRLEVELAASPGRVNAAGAAALGGTVALSTATLPAPSASFQFLTYASRTGRFDEIDGFEIEPGRSFSVHYNNTRALAIAGEWAASGTSLVGEIDVPSELLVSGPWLWNGTLVKWGEGDLVLDLSGVFSADATASLAIVEGRVLLQGIGHSLTLDNLHYGELGVLSGNPSLSGQYGWYGPVTVPEPAALSLFALATACALHRRRALPSTRIENLPPIRSVGTIAGR
jgi:hypothetical protein